MYIIYYSIVVQTISQTNIFKQILDSEKTEIFVMFYIDIILFYFSVNTCLPIFWQQTLQIWYFLG